MGYICNHKIFSMILHYNINENNVKSEKNGPEAGSASVIE